MCLFCAVDQDDYHFALATVVLIGVPSTWPSIAVIQVNTFRPYAFRTTLTGTCMRMILPARPSQQPKSAGRKRRSADCA